MSVGFTGTRDGMTAVQKVRLANLLSLYRAQGHTHFHHGDCLGADAEAHKIAVFAGFKVIVHPPLDSKERAYCQSLIVLPPAPYLVRNKDIVNVSEFLIAAPKTTTEQVRSGTWSTVRYARKRKVPVKILEP